MSNETLILYLTLITVLLSFISVILIPLFKFSWSMDKRLTILETKSDIKEEIHNLDKKIP